MITLQKIKLPKISMKEDRGDRYKRTFVESQVALGAATGIKTDETTYLITEDDEWLITEDE